MAEELSTDVKGGILRQLCFGLNITQKGDGFYYAVPIGDVRVSDGYIIGGVGDGIGYDRNQAVEKLWKNLTGDSQKHVVVTPRWGYDRRETRYQWDSGYGCFLLMKW